VFDDHTVYISVLYEYQGERRGLLACIQDGDVVGFSEGLIDAHRYLGETRSLAIHGTTATIMTEQGLVWMEPTPGGDLYESKILEEARGLFAPGCQLFYRSEDQFYVVGSDKVYRLEIGA
jgi:hypothetical protein